MFISLSQAFFNWFVQVRTIIFRQVSHMSPQEYCIWLTLCICVGFVMLRGKS